MNTDRDTDTDSNTNTSSDKAYFIDIVIDGERYFFESDEKSSTEVAYLGDTVKGILSGTATAVDWTTQKETSVEAKKYFL